MVLKHHFDLARSFSLNKFKVLHVLKNAVNPGFLTLENIKTIILLFKFVYITIFIQAYFSFILTCMIVLAASFNQTTYYSVIERKCGITLRTGVETGDPRRNSITMTKHMIRCRPTEQNRTAVSRSSLTSQLILYSVQQRPLQPAWLQ